MFFKLQNRIVNADQIAEFAFDRKVTTFGVEITFYAKLTNGEQVELADSVYQGIPVNEVASVDIEASKELRKMVKALIFLE